MRRKGLRALFFVGVGGLAAASVVWYLRQAAVPLPKVWIFYAKAHAREEVLYGREYTAQGQPISRAIRIGPLGLVQQVEVASPGRRDAVWVTLGSQAVSLRGHRVAARRIAPPGTTLLSLRDVHGVLYAVTENITTSRIHVVRWRGRWVSVGGILPTGITTLERGPGNSVWTMTATPESARVTEIVGGRGVFRTPGVEPQGTVGFSDEKPVIPYAVGSNGFGYWTGRLHRFSSVFQAAVSVTDTNPLWGLSVRGMVPFRSGQFAWNHLVPWPTPQETTPTVVGGQGPWIAVLDGFSQGEWFNTMTGQFGPEFQIKTPWWAVVRAASLGS